MEEVFKFGQTDLDMMDSGEMEWPMAMDVLSMLREMYMRENGLKTKLMASEYILTIMEVDTKANGFRINSMGMVLNNGQMEPSMKVNMSKE